MPRTCVGKSLEKKPCLKRGEAMPRSDFPPCLSQRPFGMGARWQGVPARVFAPHSFLPSAFIFVAFMGYLRFHGVSEEASPIRRLFVAPAGPFALKFDGWTNLNLT